MDDIDDFVNLIRKQRHDFMNDFQVIYGYLQMDKVEKAKEYIDDISNKNKIISTVYNLEDGFLSLCLEKNLKKLWNKGIQVALDVEINGIDKSIFKIDYDKKCNLVNNIFNEMENNNFEFVYIYIFEDNLGKSVFISNNEGLLDELSWMDEWEKIDTSIESFNLYRCYYEKNLAYRIINC